MYATVPSCKRKYFNSKCKMLESNLTWSSYFCPKLFIPYPEEEVLASLMMVITYNRVLSIEVSKLFT